MFPAIPAAIQRALRKFVPQHKGNFQAWQAENREDRYWVPRARVRKEVKASPVWGVGASQLNRMLNHWKEQAPLDYFKGADGILCMEAPAGAWGVESLVTRVGHPHYILSSVLYDRPSCSVLLLTDDPNSDVAIGAVAQALRDPARRAKSVFVLTCSRKQFVEQFPAWARKEGSLSSSALVKDLQQHVGWDYNYKQHLTPLDLASIEVAKTLSVPDLLSEFFSRGDCTMTGLYQALSFHGLYSLGFPFTATADVCVDPQPAIIPGLNLFVGAQHHMHPAFLRDKQGIVSAGAFQFNATLRDQFPDIAIHEVRLPDDNKTSCFAELAAAVDFAVAILQKGGTVFVHCQRGISRGPTLAAAVLMSLKKLSAETALLLVREARPVTFPSKRLQADLLAWEFRVLGTRETFTFPLNEKR